VTSIDANGPAADKLEKGDIVTGVNRTKINSLADYKAAVAEAKRSGKKYVMVFFERKVDQDWVRNSADIEPQW